MYQLINLERFEGVIRNSSVFPKPIQWAFSGSVLRLPYASKISSHLGHFARPLYAIGTRIAAAHLGQ